MGARSIKGGFDNTQGGKDKFVENLDDLLADPTRLKNASPEEWYRFFNSSGYNPLPLNDGRLKGMHFENGGGYKINWGGDRILQYRPLGGRHNDGRAYWKISSGSTGTARYDVGGNVIVEKGANE